jgi:hypothetical protein
MAVAMREAAQAVLKAWRRHGHDIGFLLGRPARPARAANLSFERRRARPDA